jgi:Ring finger domain
LNQPLTLNIEKTWPGLFNNCTDDQGLCRTNVITGSRQVNSNQTFSVVSGTRYFFAIGASSSDSGGVGIDAP